MKNKWTGSFNTLEIKTHRLGLSIWNLNSDDIWIEAAKEAENFFSVGFQAE